MVYIPHAVTISISYLYSVGGGLVSTMFVWIQMHDLCIRCLALGRDIENHDQLLVGHWESFFDSFINVQQPSLEALCSAVGDLGSRLRGGFALNLYPFVSVRLESIMFSAPREREPEESPTSTQKKYKDSLFNALVQACCGSHYNLFTVYCNALDLVANDERYIWRLKMELFRTLLRICWLLQPDFSQSIISASERDIRSVEDDVRRFIHKLDEFATMARMIATGEDEDLFEINSGFFEIKMSLRAELNKKRPLFLKDTGCTFNGSC